MNDVLLLAEVLSLGCFARVEFAYWRAFSWRVFTFYIIALRVITVRLYA